MQYKFIKEFRVLCGSDWKINIETALNVPLENVEEILPDIDNWIVDIKDIDNEIYHCYTGKDNDSTIQNLILLINRGARRPLVTYLFIQPRRLQQLLPYLLGQPLRLQDFDVRSSGEQRRVEVVGYPQPVFKVGPVLA